MSMSMTDYTGVMSSAAVAADEGYCPEGRI